MADKKVNQQENDEFTTAAPAHGADVEEALEVLEADKKEEDNA